MFSLKELIFNLIIIHQLINECSCEPIEKITKCLTPPNTLKRVEKVIKECQEDVKTNIFKEAFNLISGHLKNTHDEHEYLSTIDHNNDHHHHIDDGDDGTIYVVADHDNEQQHNSDISHHQKAEVEEYNFDPNENHHHNKHEHFITKLFNYHKNDNTNERENNVHNSRYTTVVYPAANTNRYSNSFTNYNNDDRIGKSIIQNKDDDDDYTHPTTVSYHDKRIAGCLMHCIYAKNHAIDKLGWPTLDGLVNLYSEGVHEHGYFMATLRATDSCLKGASLKHNVNRHLLPEKGESCDLAFDIFDCISDHITEYCSEHHYYNNNNQRRQPHHHHHHHHHHHRH